MCLDSLYPRRPHTSGCRFRACVSPSDMFESVLLYNHQTVCTILYLLTTKKAQKKRRGEERNKHAQYRQRDECKSAYTTEGRDVPRTDPPQARAHPATSSKGKREGREERHGYKLTPGSSTTVRTTIRPKKCIPNRSERANHASKF